MRFESVRDIPIECLVVSRAQARVRDIERDLDELVENIRTHGQLEPIVVARVGDQDKQEKYEIITGQRRYLAHQRLGRPTILAAVLAEIVDEATARALSLSENLIRRELNPKDLIDACTALYKKYGDARAVADELGIPYAKVIANIKYERLKTELRELVDAGEIDVNSALRVQDAAEGNDTELDIAGLAKNLAKLTRAQQNRVLRTSSVDELLKISNGAVAADSQRVVQIVVTLPAVLHARLRAWSKQHGTSQDSAAAEIIASFLASTNNVADGNRRRSSAG